MTKAKKIAVKRNPLPFVAMDEETRERHREAAEHGFRNQFEAGDKLALLDCIRWCETYSLPLSRWALTVLSEAAGKHLSGISANFHDAIFGARKDTGRHANLAMRRRESHQLLFNIVIALMRAGFKGDGRYERAHELLHQLDLTQDRVLVFAGDEARKVPNQGSIKKRFEKMQWGGVRPSGLAHLIPMMVDLGTPPPRGRK